MKILAIFEYENFIANHPFYDVAVVLDNVSREQLDALEADMRDFVNSGAVDDLDIAVQTEDFLNHLGLNFTWANDKLPELDGYHIIYVSLCNAD